MDELLKIFSGFLCLGFLLFCYCQETGWTRRLRLSSLLLAAVLAGVAMICLFRKDVVVYAAKAVFDHDNDASTPPVCRRVYVTATRRRLGPERYTAVRCSQLRPSRGRLVSYRRHYGTAYAMTGMVEDVSGEHAVLITALDDDLFGPATEWP